MSPNINNSLKNSDALYRAIPKGKPLFWKDKKAKIISSALFKDSKGVSVDRDGGRTYQQIISVLRERFPDRVDGTAMITVLSCKNNDCKVVPDPNASNPYHALIYRNAEGTQPLTQGQAKKLSRMAKVEIVD